MLLNVTPRKTRDPDAITRKTAASLLGITEIQTTRLRRDGLLIRLTGVPNYSRADVQTFIDNPWLTNDQAAQILGVSRSRVSQLAAAGRIPAHRTTTGRRVYRLHQIEVVANARNTRFHSGGMTPPAGSR